MTTPSSKDEQSYQTRLNNMDAAFNDASGFMTQISTQLGNFKKTVTGGGAVTWAQLESVSQQVAQAQSTIHQARQQLPIGAGSSSR